MKKEKPRLRKIHIDLPEFLHLKLRIKAAMDDVTMQQVVATVLEKALSDVQVPHRDKKRPL